MMRSTSGLISTQTRSPESRRARGFLRVPPLLAGTIAAALLLSAVAVAKVWLHGGEAPPSLTAIDSIAEDTQAAEFTPLRHPIVTVEVTPAPAVPVEAAAEPVAAPVESAPAEETPAPPPAAKAPAKPKLAPPPRHTGPAFNDRPLRKVKTITMVVTGYSPDARSCGKSADGITASGYSVWTNGMRLVAADTRILPFGSVISIPGYNQGRPVPVLDRGGAIKGNRLDLLFATHEEARQWGRKTLTITVWDYAD